MIVLAVDAAKKWCPMVRTVWQSPYSDVAVTVNTQEESYANPGCQGSGCMMWRWFETHVNDPASPGNLKKDNRAYGYCGLAGGIVA